MAANPTHLTTAQAVVATFAHEVMDNRLTLPGRELNPAELPAPVERARAFYASHLTPPDDSYGVVLVHQLSADTGSALLVVGYNIESQWGTAEVYSPEGELWAAGVFVASAVGWGDVDTVRTAMVAGYPPLGLIPRTEALAWIPQGPMAFVSVGGRFFICPSGQPGHFTLSDGITNLAHECATPEEAQSMAAVIHREPYHEAPAVPNPVTAAAGPRSGDGGNGKWTAESEAIEGGLRYRLFHDAQPMTYIDLLRGWLRDQAFADFFSSVLADSPIPVFRFELHPLANGILHRPCEFVLLESPDLDRDPDRRTNAEGFAEWSFPVIDYPTLGALAVKRMFHRLTTSETNEETIRIREASDPSYGCLQHVVSFLNVAKDAILIVPSAREPERVYGHLGVFLRETNEWQRRGIWNTLADGILKWGTMDSRPVMHVGTPANGPPWVHLRVDRKPWLTYPPYRTLSRPRRQPRPIPRRFPSPRRAPGSAPRGPGNRRAIRKAFRIRFGPARLSSPHRAGPGRSEYHISTSRAEARFGCAVAERSGMADVGSVTVWLGQLQGGDPEAADRLWERYFRRLQGLARLKLPAALQNNGSEEDVALAAFASLWRGAEKGRFPELAGREHLWRLLVVITVRKVHRLARTEARERASVAPGWEMEQVLARDPEPGFEMQAAEECQRLLALLGDARLEAVARWRMEGLTVPEIAARLECSPRTVDRKLVLIQTLWSEEIEP